MIHRILVVALGLVFCSLTPAARAEVPPDYRGKPFSDAAHKTGLPNIPGLVQCALYDFGGEGVAYHDTDSTNNGSGKPTSNPATRRPTPAPTSGTSGKTKAWTSRS